MMTNIKCLQWGIPILVIDLYFHASSYQNILTKLDQFPKNNDWCLVAYFDG